MNDIGERLRKLHSLHQELDRLRTDLARGPRQVQGRKRRLEQQRAEIEQSRNRLKQLRKAADEKNLQLKTNEAKLDELQVKLNQATSPREFAALKGQMEADRMANSVLEDEILEAFDKVDALESEIAKSETDVADSLARTDEFAREIAEAEAPLREQLARCEGELVEAERVIPAKHASDYRRLVQAHGPDALAAFANKACMNCQTTLTAQQAIDIRTGKFTFCRTCGRLLYPDESEQ